MLALGLKTQRDQGEFFFFLSLTPDPNDSGSWTCRRETRDAQVSRARSIGISLTRI